MGVALQIVGGLIVVVATLWLVGLGVYWLYDRGEIATTTLIESDGTVASQATQKRVYEERVAWVHRFYSRLRRGFPWVVGVLAVGIGLCIVGVHLT